VVALRSRVGNCPECGAEYRGWIVELGEAVCWECGLVVDEKALREYKRRRVKARSKKPSNYVREDGAGSWIRRFKASNSSEDRFAWGLFELEKAASVLGLSREVKEEAASILARAVKRRLTRGRRIQYTVAACTYIACRLRGDVRGLGEISKAMSAGERRVYRTYMKIRRKLGIRLEPVAPVHYVRGLCNAMKLGGRVRDGAVEILEKAGLNRTQGRNPIAMSAAAIYLACWESGKKISQQEVLWKAGVSEATLRHRLNELRYILSKTK
jgi:transcription initiation factor TFIIB